MDLITRAVRGTQDVLPADSHRWQFVEETALTVAKDYGYREMRTPVFEHTALFERGVGEGSDIVQKEMYTFPDKGGRSLTLRPEGTAGTVRAFLEHGLHNDTLPLKVCYISPCYRYENPQAGRQREFHQFGVECFGTASPAADAEIIALGAAVLDTAGVRNVTLKLNSIGCPDCRAAYHAALKEYFTAHLDDMCPTCHDRLARSPMRILDCKSPVCGAIAAGAPVITEYLCDDCRAHFEEVKTLLAAADIEYELDPRLVRGLDYYTRTVFEFVSSDLGAQATVCGGGRYDGLCDELAGVHVPALGFGMGLERLLLILEKQGAPLPEPPRCELYLAPVGAAAVKACFALATQLRAQAVACDMDVAGKGLKAQMKYADKTCARYVCVVGDDELAKGTVTLKNMGTGETSELPLDDDFCDAVFRLTLDRELAQLADTLGNRPE
ncbi:MAG: histidine--tRNA ligase [Oscillospiraceae bacterium]|nr:histidine--tRNA ligase [Oscillospiraceae bacterium]